MHTIANIHDYKFAAIWNENGDSLTKMEIAESYRKGDLKRLRDSVHNATKNEENLRVILAKPRELIGADSSQPKTSWEIHILTEQQINSL